MANDAPHYRDLAARAYAEADAATLDNARDRALRSAAAFETMALQMETAARRRAEREARSEADVGAEATGESDAAASTAAPADRA